MENEASRQGQTYHTADGGVVKNKGEKIATKYSEREISFVRDTRSLMRLVLSIQ